MRLTGCLVRQILPYVVENLVNNSVFHDIANLPEADAIVRIPPRDTLAATDTDTTTVKVGTVALPLVTRGARD